jgi:excisionase family DNA binding protein
MEQIEFDILDSKKLLTIKQVSERLNISRTTLWRLTSEREIPYLIISKKTLFDGKQLKNWLEKRQVKTA